MTWSPLLFAWYMICFRLKMHWVPANQVLSTSVLSQNCTIVSPVGKTFSTLCKSLVNGTIVPRAGSTKDGPHGLQNELCHPKGSLTKHMQDCHCRLHVLVQTKVKTRHVTHPCVPCPLPLHVIFVSHPKSRRNNP